MSKVTLYFSLWTKNFSTALQIFGSDVPPIPLLVENYTLNCERIFEINFYTLFSFFIHSIFLINENFNGGEGMNCRENLIFARTRTRSDFFFFDNKRL